MSKKASSVAKVVEEVAAAPVAVRNPTFFETLDSEVWELPTRDEQFKRFVSLLDLFVGGICRQTIVAEELFLLAAHCHAEHVQGEHLELVFNVVKSIFEAFQTATPEQPWTLERAFKWVRERLTNETDLSVGEQADPSATSVEGEKIRLSVRETEVVIEYLTNTIFAEFDLYSGVFSHQMDQEPIGIRIQHPPIIVPHTPLASATFTSIADEEAAALRLAKQDEIISRMLDQEVRKAQGEVDNTIQHHKQDLDAKLDAIRKNNAQ